MGKLDEVHVGMCPGVDVIVLCCRLLLCVGVEITGEERRDVL